MGLGLAGKATAQTTAAPQTNPPQWQTSMDIPAGCTDDWKNRDWYFSVNQTRDGRYLAAGYTGIITATTTTLSCTAPVNTIRPMLDLRNADGSPAWTQPYVRALTVTTPATRAGRFFDAVEMNNGDFAAVGYQGTRLLVGIFDAATGTLRQPLIMPVAYAAKGVSIREVLEVQEDGSLAGNGFIIGGVARADLTGSESRNGTEEIDSTNAREAGGAPTGWRIYMLRLDASGSVLWDAFLGPSASDAGVGAIARPIYANGTTSGSTPSRVAHAPVGTGQVTGYAVVGTDLTNSGTQPQITLYRIDGEPTSMVTVADATVPMRHRSYRTAGIPYCDPTVAATAVDIPTDLEQSLDGSSLLVATLYNRIAIGPCIVPGNAAGVAMAGESYLLGFPVNFTDYIPASGTPPGLDYAPTDIFVTICGAGETRPQIEAAGINDYVVAASRLVSEPGNPDPWTLNRYYLTRFTDTGSGLARQWEVEFAPPTVGSGLVNRLACAFGMTLTQDGGYVVVGNDDKYRTALAGATDAFRAQDHDAIMTKLLACGFDISATNTDIVPSGSDYQIVWNTPRRIHGQITVKNGAELIIDGATIQFDDTRAYQTSPTSTPTAPTRIVVENDSKLTVINGGRLTVLQAVAGCSPDPGASARMWDGVVLKRGSGATYQPYEVVNRALIATPAVEYNNAVIDHAHIGALAGRMNYSSNGLPAAAVNDGGGLVVARNTRFLNCHTGIILEPWSVSSILLNYSRALGCTFLADAPLADALYINGSVRYGTQFGMRLYNMDGVVVQGNTFEQRYGTTAFPEPLLANRGTGISTVDGFMYVEPLPNGTGPAIPNTFRFQQIGIDCANSKLAYPVWITGNRFEGNRTGINLGSVAQGTVTDNLFFVGRSGDASPTGLIMQNSYGYNIARNTFTATTASPAPAGTGGSTTARGIAVSQSDGSNLATTRENAIYNNHFDHLYRGIYAQDGNQGLWVRCNHFDTALSNADVRVALGTVTTTTDPLKNPHGDCDPLKPELSIANFFSHTGGSAKDILISATSGLTTNVNTLQYKHFTGLGPAGTLTKVNATDCTTTYEQPRDCPDYRDFETARLGHLVQTSTQNVGTAARLALPTDTTGDAVAASARMAALDELLRRYLDLRVYAHGLDSAVALLRQAQEPGYEEQLTALEIRGGYTPSNRQVAPPTVMETRPVASARRKRRQAVVTAPVWHRTTTGSYFDQVRELLAPLGTDSAIAVTLQADSALRAELWQIANDTLTWGFGAGRAVLTRYLGYQFRPWEQNDPAEELGARGLAQAEARKQPATLASVPPAVALFPNPTAETVQLAYRLPAGAAGATLRIVDKFGKSWRTVALPQPEGQITVDLRALPAGLYSYVVLVGEGRVQSGTLVKLP